MPTAKLLHPVMIRGPIVLLPADEYRALLAEAGYLPTPHLARQLSAARSRFRKGRVLSWEQLKGELH